MDGMTRIPCEPDVASARSAVVRPCLALMIAPAAEPTIEECRERIARTVEHIRTAGRTWADFLLLHATKGFDDPSQAEVMLADLFDKHIDQSLPPAFNDKLRAECLAAFRERFALIAPHAERKASA